MPTTRVPCSNAAKTRNQLKLAEMPQTNEPISATSGLGRTCWRRVREGVTPSRHRGPGVLPWKFLKITLQNHAILCKIGQYLCRKSTTKVVLISDILLADKADSQSNKRELNFNCLQLQHSYAESHPRLRRLDETAHRMQRVHLQYRMSSNTSRVCNIRLVSNALPTTF